MKQTITYTNSLTNFDDTKIPMEQQICLMKASDLVKEKAMLKLKEVKAKSEDSGSKARHYLDGLMKIPFGIYKEEPILKVMNECVSLFNDLIKKINATTFQPINIPQKNNYTSMEMRKYICVIKDEYYPNICKEVSELIRVKLISKKRNAILNDIIQINGIIKKYSMF